LPFKADALGPDYARAFKLELATIIHAHPRYVWGGSESEAKGLDCSGYLFLAARRAGMPVRRTTAIRMAAGESGWTSIPVPELASGRDLDIVWWTLKASRPNGHVGIIWGIGRAGGRKAAEEFQVSHASGSRGVIVEKIRGWIVRKMTAIRRLTIGD